MRKDETSNDCGEALLTELGAASELTQGAFMPTATESLLIKDYFDQP